MDTTRIIISLATAAEQVGMDLTGVDVGEMDRFTHPESGDTYTNRYVTVSLRDSYDNPRSATVIVREDSGEKWYQAADSTYSNPRYAMEAIMEALD